MEVLEHAHQTNSNSDSNAFSQTYFQRRLCAREQIEGLSPQDVQSLDRAELYRRLENAVGNTQINRFSLSNGNTLLQKNETNNPSESHYDRCYVRLLKDLENKGEINPGDILLETTSGSAGVSFAWICKVLGYEAIVFMPSFVPSPRIVEVRNLASAVHLNNNREIYLLGCAQDMFEYYKKNIKQTRRSGRNMYMPNHSQDLMTPTIFSEIMDECWGQSDQGKIDYFIGGIGNGSTLLGIGEQLKCLNPDAKIIAFEPVSACPFYQRNLDKWGNYAPKLVKDSDIPEQYSFHQLPGTGSFGNVDFPFMDTAIEKGIIDDICPVPDGKILNAVNYNDELDEEQKLGNSSLVARYIADSLAENVSNKTILVLAYDRADRYGEPRYITM